MQVHILVVMILLIAAFGVVAYEARMRFSAEDQLRELREEFDDCYTALVKQKADLNLLTADLRSAALCINMQRRNAETRDQQLAEAEETVGTQLAEIKSLQAQLNRAQQRLEWLHSPTSDNVDGWDWGIYRVQWALGQPTRVLATFADFSDLDRAIEQSQGG